MALVFRSSGSPVTNTQADSNISQLDAGTVVQSGYTGNLDVNTLYTSRMQRNVTKHDLPSTTGSPIYITCNGMHIINVPSNCQRLVYLNLHQNGSNALIRVEGTDTTSTTYAQFVFYTSQTAYMTAAGHTYENNNQIPIPVNGDGTASWVYLFRHGVPGGHNESFLVLGYEPGTTI